MLLLFQIGKYSLWGPEPRAKEERFTKVDDELQYLKARDPFFPPDADPARALEVVPVHEDVDRQVEGNGDPGDWRLARQLRVAEEDCCAVMVAVEECLWDCMSNRENAGAAGTGLRNLLKVFFLRTRKTVSINSKYLVR